MCRLVARESTCASDCLSRIFCVPCEYKWDMKVEASAIRPGEYIHTIHKERHARRRNGELVQWFVTDKYGQLLLSSGKLSALQAYINANATHRHEHVHLGGLYQSMSRNDSRTGGYYQNRWKVCCAPLEDAVQVFEKLRPGFDRAVIVGSSGSYVKELKM